ncbi:MAG: hypothetical protein FWF59_04265 [Turicibacter sp.]|nr:hypothetical protein [Turicibacter sp.]
MLEFLKHLKEDRLSKRLIEERYTHNEDFPYRTRFFEEIPFKNGITLSIQASGIHNSKPEKTLSDLTQYEAFELGLKTMDVKNFVSMDYATRDKAFSQIFRDYFDGSIYSSVPTPLIEDLFQKMKNEYGLAESL